MCYLCVCVCVCAHAFGVSVFSPVGLCVYVSCFLSCVYACVMRISRAHTRNSLSPYVPGCAAQRQQALWSTNLCPHHNCGPSLSQIAPAAPTRRGYAPIGQAVCRRGPCSPRHLREPARHRHLATAQRARLTGPAPCSSTRPHVPQPRARATMDVPLLMCGFFWSNDLVPRR